MAATASASLSSLLSKSSLDDHEEFLQASEAVLKGSPADLQAQRVKAVALLKLDRYREAVSFFEKASNELQEKAALEYAYALYKAGRLEEAAQLASRISDQRGAQHVEAQATYRLEHFARTIQLYSEMSRTPVHNEEFDMKVNQGAIDAQGQWLGLLQAASARRPDRDDLSAFETAYNAACGSIARGEFSQAEVLLKRARTLCQHSEELTDDQKVEEILPIMVQQMYVLYRQGKASEAAAVASEVKVDDIADKATQKIASSNRLLCLNLHSNPFMAHKIINSAPKIPEDDKPFSYQSIPISSNDKTIDVLGLKFGGLNRSTRRTQSKLKLPNTSTEALLSSVFDAASLAKNEAGQAAINKVLPELKKRPVDLGLTMTLVQMYTLIGNTTSAIELMESMLKRLEESTAESEREIRYHPGLVSIVTALYRLQGRKEHVKRELAEAASYWRQRPQPPTTLLQTAGVSLLASSNPDDVQIASEIFDKLYKAQPNDKATIAGYMASNALVKPESVRGLADKLKPISELVSDVDVSALEATGIPQASNALAIAQAGNSRKRTVPSGADSGRNKRVRKSRLPKNYDANNDSKPDAERWLPMRDRSYYRPPKGRRKGRKGDDRTQGGAINEELDVSKQPQKGGEVVSGGGGAAKKKKGKGKK